MTIDSLISTLIPPLKITDTGDRALILIHQHNSIYIPVIDNKKYIGLLTEDEVLEQKDPVIQIKDMGIKWFRPFAERGTEFKEALQIISTLKLNLLPIIDKSGNYLGVVTQGDVINHMAVKFEGVFKEMEENDFIKIPEDLRIAIKQYLIYFSEFVKKTKGKEISFEVSTAENGLTLRYGTSNISEVNEIKQYLAEYLGLIKQSVDELKVNIEVNLPQHKMDILYLELKNEIIQLKHKLEIKVIENKLLDSTIKKLGGYLETSIKNSKSIYISANLTANQKVRTNQKVNIKIKNRMKNLTSSLIDLKEIFGESNPEIANELSENIEILEKLNNTGNLKEAERPLLKIKNFLTKLGKKDSEYNQFIKGVKNAWGLFRKASKLYNSIAQYLGIPEVPDVLI